MKSDYCAYPPQLADDVEITEQRDGARTVFILGAASVGRYLLLRATEQRVVSLLDGARRGADVCREFGQQTGASLSLPTLVKFLSKLDDYGILAGARARGVVVPAGPQSARPYKPIKLFNPDPLFTRLLPKLRWIWTPGFFAFSVALMVGTLLLALMHTEEVVAYGAPLVRDHYLAIFIAAYLIGVTHEFAHGMTCKAFGGRATEVGVLIVYYFLFALYCNVSGIHLIPTRGRRLWVIAAGVYWQLLVGTFLFLVWFLLAPHTSLSDFVFICLLGSVLDVFFNANPLIKLDGYYFLSQWLRLPNLMDRSRAYWRGVLKRILFGEQNAEAARYDRRERAIYLVFGLLSFSYNVVFASLIVVYVGNWLIERFYLLGLVLAVGVTLIFMRRPIGQAIQPVAKLLKNIAVFSARERGRQHKAWGVARSAEPQVSRPVKHIEPAKQATDDQTLSPAGAGFDDFAHGTPRVPRFALHPGLQAFARLRGLVSGWLRSLRRASKENEMADNNQTSTQADSKDVKPPFWRRRLVPLSLVLLAVLLLLMPWSASVGNYGTLIAVPQQETILRAPESATLVALRVQPGDRVAGGAIIGQMGNLDLDDQLVQVQTDLARVNADYDRLLGELRAREEAAARAGLQLQQRQHEYDEIEAERRQIAERNRLESSATRAMVVSTSPTNYQLNAAHYPAALAVLQSEVEACRAQVTEAVAQRDRVRKLHAQGILPRSELDTVETRAATLNNALAAASQRLDAALIEHRRKHTSTTTEVNVARSDLSAERMQLAKLSGELNGVRELIRTLEARRDLLSRKRSQFELVSPRAGAIFGEELPRLVGQYFQKGAEICRIADTRQLLLRVSVPEREIGDVRVGHPVRLKTRSFPDHVFRGVVSKIGGESELDQNNQATYRVELTIENGEGLLRPGMTAFARIDFDRQMIAHILLHKIKQALRPELWML